MKELFLYLRAKIMAIPTINWVDLDKGQLNQYDSRPSIDFPAVLLKIEYPSTSKISRKQQQCNVLITATLAFDFMDDTDSITEEEPLSKSLQVYDIASQLHETLQGHIDNAIIRSPMDRVNLRDPNRVDTIKVITQTYRTKIIG
ncbi:hypothetical protein [Sphingobacterium psychroaquaticum]|uniref:Uncharacterized protein n=1 Tax=Sphingobacterium psychroaquaticum TaxID=561061 RepID=A0A1X7K5Q6_9SPHI|nr:hypothetical protein [Sphingobacterium psychroaquaticum]SMG35651.1 hypothetical protein SAMN05660862_2534 [Sphingobacterium psychroaquaticum]